MNQWGEKTHTHTQFHNDCPTIMILFTWHTPAVNVWRLDCVNESAATAAAVAAEIIKKHNPMWINEFSFFFEDKKNVNHITYVYKSFDSL